MLSISEALKQRTSVRSFTSLTPPQDELIEVCGDSKCLIPVKADVIGNGRIGTYGIITGKPAYIAVVGNDEFAAGMAGERAVIELTRRGFATCWLGVTFNRQLVSQAIGLPEGTPLIAVIAVGYAAKHRSIVDGTMRLACGAFTRKNLSKLIVAGSPAADLSDAIEALRSAPSNHNCQPWRLAFNPNGNIDVYADPHDKSYLLDVGIAVSHFLLVAPEYKICENKSRYPGLKPIVTLCK